jgi:hypothetical protein
MSKPDCAGKPVTSKQHNWRHRGDNRVNREVTERTMECRDCRVRQTTRVHK